MRQKWQYNWWQGLAIVGLIWLAGGLSDRLWFALDHSVPAWDQADYLNGALNYGKALQQPQWFEGDWWRSFWLLSNKIPPLTYLLTVPFLNLFGSSADAATLVMLVYSAVLLSGVYGLGVALFDVSVGLWAAGLCQLLPGLYYYRLEFLLDYPLTAIVTFSFWLLTVWQLKTHNKNIKTKQNKSFSQSSQSSSYLLSTWLLAIAFGISLGLALLLKQTALFFLFLPLLWVFGSCLKHRQWLRLTQLISSLIVGILICFPWYRTNWLLILTSGKRATLDSAIAEGDPPLNTIDAWLYYVKVLPYLLSWCLLLIPIACLIIYTIRRRKQLTQTQSQPYPLRKWRWLTVFLLGGYLLSSLNINKDARYILPLLPVLALVLAVGLLSGSGRWQKYLRWVTVGVATVLMILNIFSLGGTWLTAKLSPRVQHYPYTGQKYPHPEVVQAIINTSPYLRSTLGVLPSTPEINQHNFSFYGGQHNFQVVGRQVGVRQEEVEQDARSLDWFVTKTGDQGSIPEAQAAIVNLVETGGDFTLQKSWQLPDESILKLYHRLQPLVEVKPSAQTTNQVTLNRIIVPKTSPPGVPIPVTYQWSGSEQELQSGIVLITWKQQGETENSYWLHDHGIGMGALARSQTNNSLEVIERTAMLSAADTIPGEYNLAVTYLNRKTGETYPIAVPPTTITIASQAEAVPAPELDLVTQLRAIAPNMAQGIAGLEPIFAQTARINQYDAQQNYLKQTEIALSYRIQQDNDSLPQQLQWLYAVALAQVLQQDVEGAIASWQQIIQLDPQNPYNYAYLAFVYLYDWQPHKAETALNSAMAINPNIPEIHTLQGVAALMQGRFIKAWQLIKPSLQSS